VGMKVVGEIKGIPWAWVEFQSNSWD